MNSLANRIVPITELRRNFGEITENLAKIESLILTRGGEPFAILKAYPREKKKVLKGSAGAWKGSALDNDSFWKSALKKKSRRDDVVI